MSELSRRSSWPALTKVVVFEAVFSISSGIGIPLSEGFYPTHEAARRFDIGSEGDAQRAEHVAEEVRVERDGVVKAGNPGEMLGGGFFEG